MSAIDVRLKPEWVEGVGYRYDVLLGDEVIVRRSRDPEHDTARALLARGVGGRLRTIDFATGRPRMIVDIAKAARVTIVERDDGGLALVAHHPMTEHDKARARVHRIGQGLRLAGGIARDSQAAAERAGALSGVPPRAYSLAPAAGQGRVEAPSGMEDTSQSADRTGDETCALPQRIPELA
jgi:hypothetical protein